MATQTEPLALSMPEAARALSVSRAQIYRIVASGQLRTVIVGKTKRVPRQALEELLAGERPAAAR